ncbi:L,D-transpeptidase [Streptomyces aurantiogriseus]|uniref:Secreted protein n=1 Tax=Streptomyces aurantiogriseus TaxID=66870 RepID=A0A918C1K0_9ACTN|nr:L,D-transpeptidase [Streptomyces aurantiogriseus]GGR00060.1 hypothetical protein GCM10010251_14160 [Streptomyces aurantiogriseus]
MASSSSTFVAGLTAAALATVGFLAFQASANGPVTSGKPQAGASPTASKAPRDRKRPTSLPSGSGKGERVVYSVDDDRVWLVRENGKVERTFKVAPGSVDPAPGAYHVTSRSKATTGSDGIPIEHVVRFASVGGVVIGFSTAVGGPAPVRYPAVRTGGIRQSRADGDAMWRFATIGVRIVVIR